MATVTSGDLVGEVGDRRTPNPPTSDEFEELRCDLDEHAQR